MTNYGDVYAEHTANEELATKVNALKAVLVRHIGYLKSEDKILFRKQVEVTNYILYLMNQKNSENLNLKAQLKFSNDSVNKDLWKKILAVAVISILLWFFDVTESTKNIFIFSIVGYFVFNVVQNSFVSQHTSQQIKANLDACELLTKDLIANGLTQRDSYDYDIKKSQIEILDVADKFKELTVLEFEYETYKREMKILSANYDFKRDDDFYEV